MKKIRYTILLLLLTAISYAQGIQFIEGSSWEQIRARAKAEKKFIFVDCYATWCGPCKLMDAMIYPDQKVGTAINSKFLSVKLQFDVSSNDNEQVKQWRETANVFLKDYKIRGYPSFLFFSPEGTLVHQSIGAKGVDDFIAMANLALTNPREKLKNELANYKQGKKDYIRLPVLIDVVRESGNKSFADSMVLTYKQDYLDKLPADTLSKENFRFLIANFQLLFDNNRISSKDNFFHLMYSHPENVDRAWAYPVSKPIVNAVITKEEITAKLWRSGQPITLKPDWDKLRMNIAEKYKGIDAGALVLAVQPVFYNQVISSKLWNGSIPMCPNPDWRSLEIEIGNVYNKEAVLKMVSAHRLNFYKRIGNWKEFAKFKDLDIQKNTPKPGDDASWALNMDAWDTFLSCLDNKVLERALFWSDLSIKLDTAITPNVQLLDTRAHLLYKLGRVKEAIDQEEKAIAIDKASAETSGRDKGVFADTFSRSLEKMKAGIPTWHVPEVLN